MLLGGGSEAVYRLARELEIWEYFLGCFGEMGGEWICLGVVDLLGIISFFLRVVVGVSCSVVGPKRYERWGVVQ